jgi:hypothetical protein
MRYIFIISLLVLCSGAYAQKAEKVVLHGTIAMATGEQFPYRIEVTENNNVVTGYAYTYDERDEAKAIIKGKVDKQNKKLTFKETEIVRSSLVTTHAFMCMVQAALEYKSGKLKGPAVNKQLDNTSCTEGTITFSNAAEIDALFASHDEYDMEVKMGEKKKPEAAPEAATSTIPAAVQESTPEKITAGVEKSYSWYSDSVVIEVFDGGYFDGDMVSIYLDDKAMLSKFVILKQKKRIVVALPPTGVHTISIVAENEGSDPPNTATLRLLDGATPYNIVAYNNKGDKSFIRVKRAR